MPRTVSHHVPALLLLAAFVAVLQFSPRVSGQTGGPVFPSTDNGEWPHYSGDVKGSRYTPLDQIDATNFNKLEVAWRLKTDNLGPRLEFKLEGTPLMVKDVIYAVGGTRRAVVPRWPHASSRAAASPTGPTAAATSASSS